MFFNQTNADMKMTTAMETRASVLKILQNEGPLPFDEICAKVKGKTSLALRYLELNGAIRESEGHWELVPVMEIDRAAARKKKPVVQKPVVQKPVVQKPVPKVEPTEQALEDVPPEKLELAKLLNHYLYSSKWQGAASLAGTLGVDAFKIKAMQQALHKRGYITLEQR